MLLCFINYVFVCVGGIISYNLQVLIPGTLTVVIPIARGGSDGWASHFDPCVLSDVLKLQLINPRNQETRYFVLSPTLVFPAGMFVPLVNSVTKVRSFILF